ncbi:1551_t:CDS:2, partial [Acaulospora colombiana]
MESHRIDSTTLDMNIPIAHKPLWWERKEEVAYKATYLLGQTALYYMVKPPKRPSPSTPVIVALHGAGVEASHSFWTSSIPQRDESWIIFPNGRTPWMYGDQLYHFTGFYKCKKIGITGPLMNIERFSSVIPMVDKALAIPAAAYIKSQLYIPLHHSHGSHFIDAQLKWILESTLLPDDNDVFASNLVKTPILSIHGWRIGLGDEELEPEAPHWWKTVLASPKTQYFLNDIINSSQGDHEACKDFVLSVATPEETGSLCGIKIEEITVPGRLGRIYTQISSQNEAIIQTNN